MSDIENEEEIKNIATLKIEKKKLKQLNPEVSKIRSENMKKALEQKKKNFENKNNLKKIEYNISDLINTNVSSDEEIIEKKDKKKNNTIKNEEINNENYKNLLDTLNNTITNINKKVEKLYIMKKNKPKLNQPIYVNKDTNNNSNDLLNAIKNKMLNN